MNILFFFLTSWWPQLDFQTNHTPILHLNVKQCLMSVRHFSEKRRLLKRQDTAHRRGTTAVACWLLLPAAQQQHQHLQVELDAHDDETTGISPRFYSNITGRGPQSRVLYITWPQFVQAGRPENMFFFWPTFVTRLLTPRSRKSGYGLLLGCRSG